MATLSEIRTRVRAQLGETSAAIWSDTDLDEAINSTLEDYNQRWSYQAVTTVSVEEGDAAIDEPDGTLDVVRVQLEDGTIIEYRSRNVAGSAGRRERQAWERWGGQVHFTRPLTAQTLTIWYLRGHEIEEVPAADVGLIVAGAVWRALEMRSVDDLRRQGISVQQGHRETVEAARERYHQLLDRRGRRVRVR